MDISDTARVLAKLQIVDNRTVDKLTVAAWHELIGDLDARDAMEAVTHHQRSSTDYVTPAHIISAARAARSYRALAERRERAIQSAKAGPMTVRPDAYSADTLKARFPGEYRRGQADGESLRAYYTTLRETGDQREAERAKANTHARIMADAPTPTVTPAYAPSSPTDYVEPAGRPDVDADAVRSAKFIVLGCPVCVETRDVPPDHEDPDSVFDDMVQHINRRHMGTDWRTITITEKDKTK